MSDHTCFKCDFFDIQKVLSMTGNVIDIPVCQYAGKKKLALGICENFIHTDYLAQAIAASEVKFYGDKK